MGRVRTLNKNDICELSLCVLWALIFISVVEVTNIYLTAIHLNCFDSLNYTVGSKVICLVSAPFNISEIAQFNGNFILGILNIVILPALQLFFYEFYNRFIVHDFRYKLSTWKVVFYSVCATWITSALFWCYVGYPATGTSIISFSLAMLLFISIVSDLRYFKSKKWSASFFAIALAMLYILITDLNNVRHPVGGFFFLLFAFGDMMLWGIKHNTAKGTKIRVKHVTKKNKV